ncbi:UDP-N-acetylmuramoyl-L-alanine--D-glutamate ligase [candidate division WOR-3 bacterium]|nr:UDP-N-acetylmuramoyl-L-alanine--D-glutamate ligase [candidate division WOR-3 bacterium]
MSEKRVTVIGGGRSGEAAAKLLVHNGIDVFVTDSNSISDEVKRNLRAMNVNFEENEHTKRAFDCDWAVASPGIKTDSEIILSFKEMKKKIIPEIELAKKFMKANLLSVTGTNGKSTTTALAAHLIENSGVKCHVGGNLAPGKPLSEISIEAKQGEWVSAEISSFQMELVSEFETDAAIWTNVSRDHLDRHGDIENYASFKADLVKRVNKNGFAVLNSDDQIVLETTIGAECRKYYFGNDRAITQGFIDGDVAIFQPDQSVRFSIRENETQLKGRHNLENVLAAGLAAYFIGVKPEKIIESVKTFKGLPHRLEKIGVFGGVLFINNSMCTNETAFRKSLEAYKGAIAIVGGKEKKTDLNDIALSCRDLAKFVILIGSSADELSEKLKTFNVGHDKVLDMDEAVIKASKIAVKGDTVILNPGMASFDMFKDFQDRGETFKNSVRKNYAPL